jgi:outer membrane protein OmpA-like peptidoglycan-associated protein
MNFQMPAWATLVVLFSSLAPSFASAEGIPLARRAGLSIYGGGSIPLSSTTFKSSTNSGWAGGASLSYFINNEFALDASWDHLQFSPNVGNTTVDAFGANLNWRWFGSDVLSPTLGAGAGYAILGNSQLPIFIFSNAFLHAKGSLDYLLNDKWMISAGVKYFWIFNSFAASGDHSLDVGALVPQISLTLFLPAKESSPSTASPSVTPAPTATPAPEATPAASPSQSPVPSSTPAPLKATKTATPKAAQAPLAKKTLLPQCTDVPAGTKVNSLGCPVEEKVEIRLDVEFPFSKSTILKKYHPELKKVGTLLQDHPDLELSVQGHTDHVGNEDENLQLSIDRANAIRNYLIRTFTLDPRRIEAIGFGEKKPVASNKTEKGRQKNRRVIGVFSTTVTQKVNSAATTDSP